MAEWSENFEKVLRESLPRLGDDEPLQGDTPLLDYGLDSMGTVNLLVALEDALGVEFPDELLVPETFETAHLLWGHARSLMSSEPV